MKQKDESLYGQYHAPVHGGVEHFVVAGLVTLCSLTVVLFTRADVTAAHLAWQRHAPLGTVDVIGDVTHEAPILADGGDHVCLEGTALEAVGAKAGTWFQTDEDGAKIWQERLTVPFDLRKEEDHGLKDRLKDGLKDGLKDRLKDGLKDGLKDS